MSDSFWLWPLTLVLIINIAFLLSILPLLDFVSDYHFSELISDSKSSRKPTKSSIFPIIPELLVVLLVAVKDESEVCIAVVV